MDAPLGDDHVVVPGVDEADRAVVRGPAQGGLGVPGEVPGPGHARAAGRLDRDAPDLGRQDALPPRLGVEVDLVPEPDELPAEVGHIGLGAAARGVDPLEIHGQSHAACSL